MPTSRKNAPGAEDIDLGKTDEAAVEAAMRALGALLAEIAAKSGAVDEEKRASNNQNLQEISNDQES